MILRIVRGVGQGWIGAEHRFQPVHRRRTQIRPADQGDDSRFLVVQGLLGNTMPCNSQEFVWINPQGIGKADTGLRTGPSLAGRPLAHAAFIDLNTTCQIRRSPVKAVKLISEPRCDFGVFQGEVPENVTANDNDAVKGT